MGCLKYTLEPPVRTDYNSAQTVEGRPEALSFRTVGERYIIVFDSKAPNSEGNSRYTIGWKPLKDNSKEFSTELYRELSRHLRVKTNLRHRLEELAALKENWDHYGAVAVEKAAVRNMKAVIARASATALAKWNLFPSTNGTLLLTAKGDAIGSISIGNDGYSYALMVGDEVYGANEQKFDAREVANLLSELSEHF